MDLGSGNSLTYDSGTGEITDLSIADASSPIVIPRTNTDGTVVFTAFNTHKVGHPSSSFIIEFASNSAITSIGQNAFAADVANPANAKLTSIVLPPLLTSIGDAAFDSNEQLSAIDFSGTQIETIGLYAFYRCSALTSVQFPDSLQTLGASSFQFCSLLNSIEFLGGPTVPALLSIGGNAFFQTNMHNSGELTGYDDEPSWTATRDPTTGEITNMPAWLPALIVNSSSSGSASGDPYIVAFFN